MPRTLPHQLDRNPAASRLENTGVAIPKPPLRITLARLPVSFEEGDFEERKLDFEAGDPQFFVE